MDASQIRISDTTLQYNRVNFKRRQELRRAAIIRLIKETPSGEAITLNDFAAVARFNSGSAAHNFLQFMLRDGLITKLERKGHYGNTYTVNDAKTVKPPAQTESQPVPALSLTPSLETMAKDYLWSQKEFSAQDQQTIKGFIEYVQEQGKGER